MRFRKFIETQLDLPWKIETGSPGSKAWVAKWVPKIMQWQNVDEEKARTLARRLIMYGFKISPQAIERVEKLPDKKPPPPPFRVTARDKPMYFGKSAHLCNHCGRELAAPGEDFCYKCKSGNYPSWINRTTPDEKYWWDELEGEKPEDSPWTRL